MKVFINGKAEELPGEMTLVELLSRKGLEPDRLVVEYNYNVVKKEEWSSITVKENDVLEVLSFVGGG